MAFHNTLGKLGEILAISWLKQQGYEMLEHNWRYRRLEIDIIALKEGSLRFIEVKTRNRSAFGNPEDSVSYCKFRRLRAAAQAYLGKHPGYRWIQYDILAITLEAGADPEYFLLEDVYF